MEEKYLSIYYDDKTINKTLNNKKEFRPIEEISLNVGKKTTLPINFLFRSLKKRWMKKRRAEE